MLQNWLNYLTEQSATVQNNIVSYFADERRENSAADSGDVMADLSYCGLLKVSGEDAGNFLQTQFSNDINQVDETHSQLSSYCTPKGRMLALFRVFSDGTSYYLRMPRGLMENIHQRLQMYVLMSKVELEILPDCIGIGLSGNTAGQRLQEQLGMLPGSVNAVSHEGSTHVLQVPGILDRYEIWGEFDVIQPLWQSLANDIMPAGSNTWRYLDIQAGLPMVLQETVESFIPQMVNLQSINGVNFKKGCYPGQEIVARMQYLGTLKRRMYRCKVTGTDSPAPGTALVLADGDNGQSIGEIVDARPVAADTSLALAVITIAQAEMSLQVKGSPEYRVEVLDLPYPVEIPKK